MVADTFYLELKKKLNPPEFSGNDRPQCLEETRKRVLQSIDKWMNAEGYPNVFLLIRAAGTGKSTIATTVAGNIRGINLVVTCSFCEEVVIQGVS